MATEEASRARPFYEARGFAPVWTDRESLTEPGEALVDAICGPDARKLPPGRLDAIARGLRDSYAEDASGDRSLAAARLEVAMSDALLDLVASVRSGLGDLAKVEGSWSKPSDLPKPDPGQALSHFAETSELHSLLEEVSGPRPGYSELAAELERYRAIAREGGWAAIPAGAEDASSDSARADLLRKHLHATGDLASPEDDLVTALERFQSRHGLEPAGTLDAPTLAALNVLVEARVAQLEASLERRRWLPKIDAPRRIVINIPAFELQAFDGGKPVLSMPVIVGKRMSQTPIFADTMTYMTFRPYWNVPESIAIDEILPKIAESPGYLEKHRYEIVDPEGNPVSIASHGGSSHALPAGYARDESSGALLAVHRSREARSLSDLADGIVDGSLRIRQQTGAGNALGLVKFMFPNDFNVYLHDTPEDHLFDRSQRGFSHGCIRVQDPVRLAEYVLEDQGWSRDEIVEAMHDPLVVSQDVPLEKAIPVTIVYLTAWVDDRGVLQFRDDVYGHDRDVRAVLSKAEPTAEDIAACAEIRSLLPGEDATPDR